MEKKEIMVSERLAKNIEMLKNDQQFIDSERAEVAEALYGISLAEHYSEGQEDVIDKLKIAKKVIFDYMFHLDIMTE